MASTGRATAEPIRVVARRPASAPPTRRITRSMISRSTSPLRSAMRLACRARASDARALVMAETPWKVRSAFIMNISEEPASLSAMSMTLSACLA